MGDLGDDEIQEWQIGKWHFRATTYSNGKWHVWCSKSKLVSKNALFEPFHTEVLFEFAAKKADAIANLREKINDKERRRY